MKQSKFNLSLLPILALLLLSMPATAQVEDTSQKTSHQSGDKSAQGYTKRPPRKASEKVAGETAAAGKISYDKVSDHLSVTVEAASLKSVLGMIALKSGIEVLFDDAADGPLSIDIQAASLEDGLKNILKGKNHMLRYSRDEKAKLMLIGVMVLPVGEQDTGRAKRLVSVEKEAYHRAREQSSRQISVQQAQQIDTAMERWQARLGEMPAEYRERLEKKITKRLEADVQRELRRAEIQAKKKQREAEAAERRKQSREAILQTLNPEERAAFEQDGAAAREEMRVKLLGQQ